MATHRAKVIGPFEVCGVAPGGVIENLDDEAVNVPVLVKAGHVELLPEPPPARKRGGKADASTEDFGGGDA